MKGLGKVAALAVLAWAATSAAQTSPVIIQPVQPVAATAYVAPVPVQPVQPVAVAMPGWGLFVSGGGGYGIGYFASNEAIGFFHGGLVDFNVGVAYSDAPGGVDRSAIGIGYEFNAIVDSSGMIHHHYVGVSSLGLFCYKAGLGVMVLSPFDDSYPDYVGFSAKASIGIGFMIAPTVHLQIEIPTMTDIPITDSDEVVTGFTTGLQLGLTYF
jgi:hypothetical protein